jgi:hypothetical protein
VVIVGVGETDYASDYGGGRAGRQQMTAPVRTRFKVTYHPDHVGRLMHSLGWSTNNPGGGRRSGMKRRSPAGTAGTGPDKSGAPRLGAHLVFADECGFLLIPSVVKTWALAESPDRAVPDARRQVSVISGLSVSPVR